MNAAAALYLCDMAKDFKEGVDLAKKSLAERKALEKFESMRSLQGSVFKQD